MSGSAPRTSQLRKKAPSLKWEFEIVLQQLFPFLNSVEQRRFSIVNKTMHEWAEEAAKIHLRRNHIADRELKRFFVFTKTCKKSLTRKLMFDKYKELRIRGRTVSSSQLQVNRASLSVLIFFLHTNNKRALEHLVHCSKAFYPALRRAFLQTWLRVQMFTCRYPINRTAKATDVERRDKASIMKRSNTSALNEKRRQTSSSDLRQRKRARLTRPLRQRRTVKRYTPEATTLIDDEDEDEGGDSCGDSALEERSEDSDSEGSLKDFIVSDDESETNSKEDYDSCADEEELSSYETSSESGFSVYSEDEE